MHERSLHGQPVLGEDSESVARKCAILESGLQEDGARKLHEEDSILTVVVSELDAPRSRQHVGPAGRRCHNSDISVNGCSVPVPDLI